MTTYPMITPGSLDFGSVFMEVEDHGEPFRVKVYPHLVHTLKSISSKFQNDLPKSVASMRSKGRQSQKVVKELLSIPAEDMGGFRIEVTVTARTLEEARLRVMETGFLDPNTWFNPPNRAFNWKLDVKIATKAGLVANANWLYRKAVEHRFFAGNNNARPSPIQERVWIDVLASLGWSLGNRHPTRSRIPNAWWRKAVVPRHKDIEKAFKDRGTTPSPIVSTINATYDSEPAIIELVKLVRAACDGFFPCPQAPYQSYHRLAVRRRRPIWYTCSCKKPKPCEVKLDKWDTFQWIATLMEERGITRDALRLPAVDMITIVRTPSPTPSLQELDAPATTNMNRHVYDGVWWSTRWIKGDGNCMFEAFARAHGDMEASYARKKAVAWMLQNWEDLEPFHSAGDGQEHKSKDEYVRAMATNGFWGDDLALNALCGAFRVVVKVLKQVQPGEYYWMDAGQGDGQCLRLFLSGNHYENLFASDEV